MAEKSDQARQNVCDWGRQTMVSAMCVNARKARDDVDPIELNEEKEVIAQHLWEAAFNECPKPVQLQDITYHYWRHVLDWTASHRGIANV